jgi:hypothetical protein
MSRSSKKERVEAVRARMNPKFSDALEEQLPNIPWEHQILQKIAEKPEILGDPIWRIGNLYWCGTKDLKNPVVQFVPKPAQCLLLYDVYVEGWCRHVVLKARQIGFSTLICMIGVDYVIWNRDTQFNMVSLDENKAQDLLEGKIKFALDRMPPALKKLALGDTKGNANNKGELMFGKLWGIRSKVNFRSGTSHVLLVSEWGVTAVEDKKKSKEIKNGTLETAGIGSLVFLESTAKGGETGDYWDIWADSCTTNDENRNELSWNPFFTPWFEEEEYRMPLPNDYCIRESTKLYFKDLSKYWLEAGYTKVEATFDDEQMYWWQIKFDQKGADMYQEYPSTPEEAFKAPVDGEVYARQLVDLERDGMICDFRYNEALPVYAAIDEGWGDGTAVWLLQVDGTRVDFLWYHTAKHKDEQYFVNKVHSAGFVPVRWALPWDTWQEHDGAINPNCVAARYIRAGAIGCFRVPRGTKKKRVEHGKAMIRRSRFMKHATQEGLMSLMNYSWPADRKDPIHDEHSHGADGFGYAADAENLGYFKNHTQHNRMAHERNQMQRMSTSMSDSYSYDKC